MHIIKYFSDRKTNKGGRQPLFSRDLAMLCAAAFFFSVAFQMIIPVISLYALELGATESVVGLVIGVFSISALCSRIPLGRYIDTHGRKKLLLIGCLINVAGPLLYIISTNPETLIAVRALHGIGLGFWAVSAITTVLDLAPDKRRGEAIGIYSMVVLLPTTIGPVIATTVVEFLSFTHAFAIASGIGIVSTLLVLNLNESFKPREIKKSRFIDAMKNRQLVQASITVIIPFVASGALIAFVPLRAIDLGMSITEVGMFFLALAMGNLVARTIIGYAADRYAAIVIVVPFFAITTAAVIGITAGTDLAQFMISGFAFGLGQGSLVITLLTLAVSTINDNQRGTATGLFSSIPEIGILLGSSGLGVGIELWGFVPTFMFLAAITPLGALLFWVLEKRVR